jgi:hypothetical protein
MQTSTCGTYAGWNAHKRQKEDICDACRQAAKEYNKAYSQRPEAIQSRRERSKARVLTEEQKTNAAKRKREWYLANKESQDARIKKWLEENKEHVKQKSHENYETNKERYYGLSKEWRANNPELVVKYRKKWAEANTDKVKAARKKWEKNNPEKVKAIHRRRRARLHGVESEPYTDQQVLDIYGTDCHICSEPIDMSAPRQTSEEGWEMGLQIDHVTPIALGGPDSLDNVRPSHGLCNTRKGAKLIEYSYAN